MNRDNDKGKVLISRSLIVGIGKFVLLMVIIVRLYYLQVYQADRYKTLADENRISTRLLVPPRGLIYDRNGVLIATNQQNFQALIVAEQTPNLQQTLDAFKKIMPLSESEEERIKKEIKRKRSFVPIKIKDNLSWEEVAKIQLNAPDLPGIIIDEGLSRYYPYGEKMAHILGYVSSVSDKDVKDDPLLEVPGFKIGKSGIEKYYEKKLRGKGGNLKLEVNAYGRVMKEIERKDGIPGERVDLTIDARLQEKAYDLFGEESGAAVLLDVHTGEILAFVSTPSYDPNLFSQGLNNEQWNALVNNEKKPLSNKAISGQYSPGSTFKIITALAALLHDADDYKLFGEESAKNLTNARRIMAQNGVEESVAAAVCEIIRTMGYSKSLKGIRPQTLEGRIVSDADMLEATGAAGLVRCLAYALEKCHSGSNQIFDENIWPQLNLSAEEYKKPNRRSDNFINHFFEKMLKLRSMMFTEAGRREADIRHRFMVDFLREFFREHDCPAWIEFLERYEAEQDNN